MSCSVGYECAPPDGCGEHFRSLALFDGHQTYSGSSVFPRCETPAELAAAKFNAKGDFVRGPLHKDASGLWSDNDGPGRGGNRLSDPADCSETDGGDS